MNDKRTNKKKRKKNKEKKVIPSTLNSICWVFFSSSFFLSSLLFIWFYLLVDLIRFMFVWGIMNMWIPRIDSTNTHNVYISASISTVCSWSVVPKAVAKTPPELPAQTETGSVVCIHTHTLIRSRNTYRKSYWIHTMTLAFFYYHFPIGC